MDLINLSSGYNGGNGVNRKTFPILFFTERTFPAKGATVHYLHWSHLFWRGRTRLERDQAAARIALDNLRPISAHHDVNRDGLDAI